MNFRSKVPVKFKLVICLKWAKALNLTIPPSLPTLSRQSEMSERLLLPKLDVRLRPAGHSMRAGLGFDITVGTIQKKSD